MTVIDALILGIVQGLTEFLPISSSGHLIIAQNILNIHQHGNEFEVVVHLGTLASIIVIFFKDIKNLIISIQTPTIQKFLFMLVLGTLPAAAIGLAFNQQIVSMFENIITVSIALIITGIVLIAIRFIKRRQMELSFLSSIIIGCAQALAIIPGISRSGMTIASGLFCGLSRKEAARFSFLLAIPVITGAGLLTFLDIDNGKSLSDAVIVTGLCSSFLVGVFALKWLLQWLEKGKFHYYGYYCILIGTISVLL